MAKWINTAVMVVCACGTYMGAVPEVQAATTTPAMMACFNACEQTQAACMRKPQQTPPRRRTIKEINALLACNRTEIKCDNRCRVK
jgi:hypothetical protein